MWFRRKQHSKTHIGNHEPAGDFKRLQTNAEELHDGRSQEKEHQQKRRHVHACKGRSVLSLSASNMRGHRDEYGCGAKRIHDRNDAEHHDKNVAS